MQKYIKYTKISLIKKDEIIWTFSKIKAGSNPDKINAVIEIPYGSNIKYEIDKDSGAVVVDRVLYSAMFYPANYGFVPNTLAADGDPADILVLNEYPLQAGSVIPCRLIGVLVMEEKQAWMRSFWLCQLQRLTQDMKR